MSFQHWFNSETTWNQHRITSYQRCFSTVKQYGINVISTFTHDIETILHQQSLNKCIQHWINIIPISQTMLIQHQITMLHQCCSQMWDQHYINTYSGYWNNIASTFVQCLFATLDQHNFDEQKTLIQQQTSTLHQRCSQCRINVISTFTHDTETTLHQHSFNVYMQHLINVISMSKKTLIQWQTSTLHQCCFWYWINVESMFSCYLGSGFSVLITFWIGLQCVECVDRSMQLIIPVICIQKSCRWWHQQMEIFSSFLAFCAGNLIGISITVWS